jgi:hypothetical protein
LIEREQLQDSGCGAIDLLLLGSVLVTSDAVLWTLAKNLRALARDQVTKWIEGRRALLESRLDRLGELLAEDEVAEKRRRR